MYLKLRHISRQNASQVETHFRDRTSSKRLPFAERTVPKIAIAGPVARLLWRLPLTTTTPPPGSSQGPARPSHAGAGRFTLALTGSGAAEYPPTKGNATTIGAGGSCVWSVASPALAGAGSVQRFSGGWWECRPLSGRISLVPAVCFGWID